MNNKTANFHGYIRSAKSDYSHPLQTVIEFVFTDFEPNKNNQAVPVSEAENILRTALNMPVKMKFDGKTAQNHAQAHAIGLITDCRLETIDSKSVIIAIATLWNNEYPDETAYIHSALASNEHVGTSWELFYKQSEQIEGVEWLHDILVSGTAIVGKPAYGNRTRILSVAEETMEEELLTLRNGIVAALNMLDTLYYELMEIERTEAAIQSLEDVGPKLAELQSIIKSRKEKMYGMASEIETLKAALAEIEAEKAAESHAKAEEMRIATRLDAFLQAGLQEDDFTSRKELLMSLSDDQYTLYVTDIKRPVSATAEEKVKIKVPNLLGNAKPNLAAMAEYLSKVEVK